jgi:hypothetical protein
MSSLDLDTQMQKLEFEWHLAHDDSIIARSDYHSLAASSTANTHQLYMARARVDRAEALKARIMATIERLEDSMQRRA